MQPNGPNTEPSCADTRNKTIDVPRNYHKLLCYTLIESQLSYCISVFRLPFGEVHTAPHQRDPLLGGGTYCTSPT